MNNSGNTTFLALLMIAIAGTILFFGVKLVTEYIDHGVKHFLMAAGIN